MSLTCASVLAAAKTALSSVSATPMLDAEVLLAHVLGVSRTFLFAWPEKKYP